MFCWTAMANPTKRNGNCTRPGAAAEAHAPADPPPSPRLSRARAANGFGRRSGAASLSLGQGQRAVVVARHQRQRQDRLVLDPWQQGHARRAHDLFHFDILDRQGVELLLVADEAKRHLPLQRKLHRLVAALASERQSRRELHDGAGVAFGVDPADDLVAHARGRIEHGLREPRQLGHRRFAAQRLLPAGKPKGVECRGFGHRMGARSGPLNCRRDGHRTRLHLALSQGTHAPAAPAVRGRGAGGRRGAPARQKLRLRSRCAWPKPRRSTSRGGGPTQW